ncbi:hypothetical protein [Galbibacter sp. PAP.153]|uniref:hypothetical protein n=1 Tax=Galbibacter sp. PAP.153 TaxID=3104623 RepID=UPI0030090C22
MLHPNLKKEDSVRIDFKKTADPIPFDITRIEYLAQISKFFFSQKIDKAEL